jgi:hypothetical protein
LACLLQWVAVAAVAFAGALPVAAQGPKAAPGRALKKGIVKPLGPPAASTSLEEWILRLADEPPEQRRRLLRENEAFRNLPPEERQRILRRLRQIQAMPPEERARLVERYRRFNRLPPERQAEAREAYRQWSVLPEDRRALVNRAVARLRGLPPEERARSLESEPFRSRFDEAERRLIAELAEFAPPPRQDPPPPAR